jgi:glycerol-3-phosphate cytidylyltransferase
MTKIITYGTFDLFHVGHVRLFQRLRALGDSLVVGCSTDEFNTMKGKHTIMPFDQRCEILMGCRYVDEVFPESSWEQKRTDISRLNADIFAMGDDWAGKFDELSDICKVVYIPRTEDISTTEIRQMVLSLREDKVKEILLSIERVKSLVSKI